VGQIELFDAGAGAERRDEAISAAEQSEPGFCAAAIMAVMRVAKRLPLFTTDDVWMELQSDGVGAPVEPRAMGAVMRSARMQGIAEPTDRVSSSERPACHRRPLRVWRSLL
jgi:hypothetical protein